jgi:C-terminal processing protease CtpA/Prc
LAQYRRFVRYRAVPPDLNQYLDTWDKSFRDWGAAAREPKNDSGFYRLTKWDDDSTGAVVQPRGKRFRGRVVVLVDGSNSSATFQFASAVQQARLGQLVGAPTGGNRRGINGSAFFFVRLPRSHIEVDLPLVAEFPTSPQPDAGLIPDILVRPTRSDIAKGRDPVLAAALRVPVK